MFGLVEKCKNAVLNASNILIFRVDTTRFILDKPKFDYQPLPWVGIHTADIRGQATFERWEAMRKYFSPKHRTLKDIGCCVGYFCIAASEEFGIKSFGFDSNPQFLRIGRYAAKRAARSDCNFIDMLVDTQNIDSLPRTDVTLLLSVWHHWVYNFGLDEATLMLQKLWALTNDTLYFESGEEETREEFKLPFAENQSARDWLRVYLGTCLQDADITELGTFEAGGYRHYAIQKHRRSLFKVSRKPPTSELQ